MTETLAVPSDAPVETASSPKKNKGKAKSGTKKVAAKSIVKAKPSEHPPTSEMVNSAIEELNEKGGSSLQAIKKFIGANYKIDLSKANIFIRKYLVSAVTSGKLVRTKGTGASGSFKLPGPSVPTKGKRTPVRKVRNTATKKEIAVKKVTTTKVKKSPKKKTVAKKSKPVKAAKVSAKPTPKKLKASAAKPKKPAAKKPIKAAASKKKSTPKKKK